MHALRTTARVDAAAASQSQHPRLTTTGWSSRAAKASFNNNNNTTQERSVLAASTAASQQTPPPESAPPSSAPPQQQKMRRVDGLAAVADTFDGLLLDQFGVLHDGRVAYPAAIEAVAALAAAGKTLLVVSNSSRCAGGTLGRLGAMGFDEACFAGAITSGELTHRHLAARPTPWWRALGRRALHITWGTSRGAISLDGLGLETVADPDAADFILVHGTGGVAAPSNGDGGSSAAPAEVEEVPLERLFELLARAAARRPSPPPMVVANPDLVTVDGGAGNAVMPGTLAREYARLGGGPVRLMGKPDAVIYGAAREMVPTIPAARWLAVGDSLEHDIAGAQGAGIAGAFVLGGIHADDVALRGGGPGGAPAETSWDDGALRALCDAHGAAPVYVLPYFRW